ncbi:MAG: histidine phosphatase family protein [Steroidobacteraceae bacterium]|nr:histidine phosphatase family protein [Steroidobacteraceae bacterium]MCW5573667.1 histidine phosphatase family protein [Steroidobacteraceae bacterium]
MEAPRVARRQNTFLAPIWLSLLGFAVLAVASFALYARLTTTTVILVRHAEKQLGTIADPPLTHEGDERAQRLARLFGERSAIGSVQAVYATATRRAQATAAPLAARLGLQVITADDAPAALARRVRREQHGGVALIVGHSNTIPAMVAALTARADVPEMPEDEFGTIYVVSVPDVGRASVLTLGY